MTYRTLHSNHKRSYYNFCCCCCFLNITISKLTLNELKLVAKSRGIKDYENKFEDDLIKILRRPKTKTSFPKKKIRDITEDFNKSRYKFFKSNI